MRRSFLHLCAMLLVASTAWLNSCRYKDLCYEHDHQLDYNVLLKLTLELDNNTPTNVKKSTDAHTAVTEPSHMVVCFYDVQTGALKDLEYTGPYGGQLQVPPGTYNMVVYAFDTEWTQVRRENNINTLEAFTSDITSMKSPFFSIIAKKDSTSAPGPIIYTPDHLLVAHKRVTIPPFSLEEPVVVIEATASTIIETYEFKVTNITGIEYVSSVEAFITNQARSNFFGREELNTEPATIFFDVDVSRKKGMFETNFTTFGKLPGESRSYLNIVLYDTSGKPFVVVTDITEQFTNPENIIVIEDSIVIPAPPSGGIAPTVEDWEEIIRDVPIG